MILGAEHPYYMEPGHGGWENSRNQQVNTDVLWYDEEVKWGTAKFAILDQLRTPPVGFEQIVRTHLLSKRLVILATLEVLVRLCAVT